LSGCGDQAGVVRPVGGLLRQPGPIKGDFVVIGRVVQHRNDPARLINTTVAIAVLPCSTDDYFMPDD
jgi:hypothetical protein